MNDNDPTWRATARDALRAWIAAGCPTDQAAIAALPDIELTDEDLEEMFGQLPRGAVVPMLGKVR